MILERVYVALLEVDGPLLVGVSGGPDSLCLLHILWQTGRQVQAAHLDHGLRAEAAQDAAVVQNFCAARQIPFVLGQADVPALAAEDGLSIEEAARTARYRFLFDQAARMGAAAVVVGHTADDQVETVLMHLLRGSGLSGLKGMQPCSLPNAWSTAIPLLRPLLGVWRREIRAYLAENRLEPVEDHSNEDTRFYRNRLRHALIPSLESYNPQVKANLARLAGLLGEEHALLEELTGQAWQACLAQAAPGALAFDLAAFTGQPLSLQRRLLRAAIDRLRPGLRDIDFATVERALEFIRRPSRSGQRDLAAGLCLVNEGERLWLAAWEAELPAGAGQPAWLQLIDPQAVCSLPVPGEVQLANGLRLQARLVEAPFPDFAAHPANPYEAWLDAARLPAELAVRARRPGDRFQPLGLDGHSVKLSDFFINHRLPRRARAGWPVLLAGAALAWIPGLRLAHPFRLTGATRQAVHLSVLPAAPPP